MSINPALPPIYYTEYSLDNGLRVILHEDHATPIVAVNVWYHVGSKNETPGRTGFAHLFEHLMFQGSAHYDRDFFEPLQEAGGTLNGSTNADRTNYWEVVPANYLELALWLEADRMGHLLPAMTIEKLNNQRDVVKNEKRQNYDNRPYGLVSAEIAAAMYPPEHPYHWLTIGSMADLDAASMEDVQNFFRRFYVPNNASLVVAGDFDPERARRWIAQYFGPVPRGAEPERVFPEAPPNLEQTIRLHLKDRVQLPRLYQVWHTVPQWAADDAELDVLAAVLAGGKSARLYRALVYEQQIAQDVSAVQSSREIAGQFQIVATAKPGHDLAELEKLLAEELTRISSAPPSDEEMERAYNAIEASFIYRLQTVGGFGGKSDQLNLYATFLNQPDYFASDLARYARVTPADVTRVAARYLKPERLVVSVLPRERGGEKSTAPASVDPAHTVRPAPATTIQQKITDERAGAAEEAAKSVIATTDAASAAPPQSAAHVGPENEPEATPSPSRAARSALPRPQPDSAFRPPPATRHRLANNLEIILVENHKLPIVNCHLVSRTGAAGDPAGLAGAASLTAEMLDEGTPSRASLDISHALAAVGSRLATYASWDASGANLLTLARHLDRALEIYADVILNPTFPTKEIERLRATRLAAIAQRRDNAGELAEIAYAALLYGREHPYGHPLIGRAESVAALGDDHIRRFYQTYYRPHHAALVVAGDVRADELLPKLERTFAAWRDAPVPPAGIETPPPRERSTLHLLDRPGSAQSVIVMGHVGVPRTTPDYFPLVVLNTLLGGMFTSRVNLNLREDKGYTYGARTAYSFRRHAGPFAATASVQTSVTSAAITELLKELRDVRGARPVTANELEFAKQSIIRGFPRNFETSGQLADRFADLALHDLPDDYFDRYVERVRAVTLADVERAANLYLHPDRLVVLAVGDRQKIEFSLRALDGLGETMTIVEAE